MAITFNLYYKGKSGKAIKFMQEMEVTGIANAIRQKDGNLKYEYFMPFNQKDEILLIDSWESQDALDKHHQSVEMQKILELRKKYNLTVRAESYIQSDDSEKEENQSYLN